MSNPRKTFLILDGNALLHRAWHAIPPLTTADGRVVNAVYGFTNVIEKMLGAYKPDYMAVAWDLPGGTFRNVAYAPYKAHREKKADELYAQIPIIQEILTAYGIPSLSVKGFEGDDILGTVSAMNEERGDIDTLIVTGDLDALQLVSPNTKVVFFVKGLSEVKLYDVTAVQSRYNLNPNQLIDLKTLIGDTSDNLPGIEGIGEKGAGELLSSYKTVDGIMKALHEGMLQHRYEKKFHGQEKNVELMRKMVTIVRDMKIPEFSYEESEMKPADVQKLLELFRGLEFKKLVQKYEEKGDEKGEAGIVEKVEKVFGKAGPGSAGKKAVKELNELDLSQIGILLQEGQQDLFGVSPLGIVLTDGHHYWKSSQVNAEEARRVMAVLSRADMIIGHDLKATYHVFQKMGIDVLAELRSKTIFDTMVAAYLLAPGGRELAFVEVINETLGQQLTEDAPIDELAPHLIHLKEKLEKKVKAEGMQKLFEEIEMPLIPVLFQMELDGIAVDQEKLVSLSSEFEKTLGKLTTKIHKLAGRDFNIQSPSQLADILFIDLGLPTKGIKKTKTGFSTAAPELEKLEDEHEIIPLVGEYREIAKLKSTYADSLPQLVAKDGRIHTTFNQTVAATGRLSSMNPNVQNIPVRSELGREIRSAFIADRGYVLLSADYSQIELRLAAVLAQDEPFLKAFKEGADIHRRTAADILGIDEDKVTKEQREAAKATNFSILYGVGARALSRRIGMSYEEAKDFIDRYFAVHPGIAAFIDASKMKARVDGYVETMFGRRRYLPDIQSGMPQLVASSERMAMNMPVQGTNADIIKMAMIKIDKWIRSSKLRVKMLLQVHDELVFEVHHDDVEAVKAEVPKLMADVVRLEIPLVVDTATGKRWGEIE
ncbi:MAG: DNA polymerase I [Patescibacteria group bacterium]|jgi:DNA polymerase-1